VYVVVYVCVYVLSSKCDVSKFFFAIATNLANSQLKDFGVRLKGVCVCVCVCRLRSLI